MKKVAFIVQRCGLEVNGGAEQHCLSVAQYMTKYWEVGIITTCALDYITWEDYYVPGEDFINSVRILRFPVEKHRDIQRFNKLSERICANKGNNSKYDEELWMKEQGPWSPMLFDYLKSNYDKYDAFIFFTYLYATTYFGLPLVKDKAYLVPTAHDEWPIYLGIWNNFFELPKKFIFNTIEERDFLKNRFPNASLDGPIVGVAVEPPGGIKSERFRKMFNINDPYFLYLGRIDQSKGCDQLIDYYMKYQKDTGDYQTKLVLIGKAVMDLPNNPNIIATGFVDEQTKWDAIAGCEILIMPSPYESLSMVCLEAWSLGKPVLVNGKCDVLVGQCRRSQGGIWYDDIGEFVQAIRALSPNIRLILGMQGKNYVQGNYNWNCIINKYNEVIGG